MKTIAFKRTLLMRNALLEMRYAPKAVIASMIVASMQLQYSSVAAAPAVAAKEAPSHSRRQGFHHSFADAEKWAKRFDNPERERWQKPNEVIKSLKIGANDKIADIGAGTGYFSLRIARDFPSATVYAADVEPDMVSYLEQQSRKRNLSNHIPLKIGANKAILPAKVDLILVVDTYHHIDDRVSYFRALRKQLAKNGRIAIIDFTAESPEGPPPKHRISKVDLQDEMKQAGYNCVEDVHLLPYQYFLIFARR